MPEQIKKERAKKVITYDISGEENGFLIELFKDGPRTTVYLTAAKPKAFKGYHLHKVRSSHYVCIKGRMKITVFNDPRGTRKAPIKLAEHILRAEVPERLLLPINVFIGLENIGDEEAWLINFPHPSYDPGLLDEQVDHSRQELEGDKR